MSDSIAFLNALAGAVPLPDDERLILCGVAGDPDVRSDFAWRPYAWRPGKDIAFDERRNGYVAVASFRAMPDGTWRRRAEAFAAGRALMIDDIGTKLAANIVDPLPPSALIETSPGNYQAWYLFEEPVRDRGEFDALIRAFIAQKLLGSDPGMSGVTRVGRIPGFTNVKAKYGGAFRVRLDHLDADRRYAPKQIVEAFGLELTRPRTVDLTRVSSEMLRHRAEMFAAAIHWLRINGMLKREEPNVAGWVPIHCPWSAEHTGHVDTGAAIRLPSEENGFYGAFRCHHGHCVDKGWSALTDWIADEAAELLDKAAREAGYGIE